jgi:hypothetical protein
MEESERIVRIWAEERFDEIPLKLSIWSEEEDFIQILIRFTDSVMIADLDYEDGEIVEESTLKISIDTWQPGSIQTRRMPDGLVRFRHRSNDIFLAAQVRAPEWASALLEQWLLEIRGDNIGPHDRRQQVSDLKRKKESISRLLEQADFSVIHNGISQINARLDNVDDGLSGKRR